MPVLSTLCLWNWTFCFPLFSRYSILFLLKMHNSLFTIEYLLYVSNDPRLSAYSGKQRNTNEQIKEWIKNPSKMEINGTKTESLR